MRPHSCIVLLYLKPRSELFLLALIVMPTVVLAESVTFKFSGLAGLTGDGLKRMYIYPAADGKILICSAEGDETVEAKVIVDLRPGDGNLELDLGKGRTLLVTSGFSPDGRVHYILASSGSRIELNPVLFVNVK